MKVARRWYTYDGTHVVEAEAYDALLLLARRLRSAYIDVEPGWSEAVQLLEDSAWLEE